MVNSIHSPVLPEAHAVPVFHNGYMRRFFDPAGNLHRKPPEVFLGKIARTRSTGELPELGEVSGYDVVMIESLHASLDIRPGERAGSRPIVLPIGKRRQRQLLEWTHHEAADTAHAVMDTATELRTEHQAKVDSGLETLPIESELQLGSMVLAAMCHLGEKRRSGKDYYEHPRRMSLMFENAWLEMFGHERDDERDRISSNILDHDIEEATIDLRRFGQTNATGLYVLDERPLATPLVVEKVALIANETQANARQLARQNFAITRTRDALGNKMPYRKKYILGGIAIGGIVFIITKSDDIHDNRDLEPDQKGRPILDWRKSRKKLADYNWSERVMFEKAGQMPLDYDPQDLLLMIKAQSQADIDATGVRWAKFDQRAAGERALHKLSARRTAA